MGNYRDFFMQTTYNSPYMRDTPPKQKSFLRRHWIVLAIIPLAYLSALGSISYADYTQRNQESARIEQSIKETKTIYKKLADIKQAKIEAAKKAEAEAKAKAAAEAKAKAKAAAAAATAANQSTANCGVSDPASITVVINKKHCFSPLSWTPSDLTSVDGYAVRSSAATNLRAMMTAASKAGVPFGLTSTYRSYQNQVTTYNYWVATNGSYAAADTVSARPGFSEHQTGLAADLDAGSCALSCFGGTAQYTWLKKNAANYGYIERYPAGLTGITGYSPEPWHWRYVGVSVAKDMKTKGIETLESYFGVSGGGY